MALSTQLAGAIDAVVDRDAADLVALARIIHANPELRFEETKAAAWIAEMVAARKIDV